MILLISVAAAVSVLIFSVDISSATGAGVEATVVPLAPPLAEQAVSIVPHARAAANAIGFIVQLPPCFLPRS